MLPASYIIRIIIYHWARVQLFQDFFQVGPLSRIMIFTNYMIIDIYKQIVLENEIETFFYWKKETKKSLYFKAVTFRSFEPDNYLQI